MGGGVYGVRIGSVERPPYRRVRPVDMNNVTQEPRRGESYGELADRMHGASDLYPHVWDEVNEECAECGADDQEDACISHPDWVTEL